MLPEGRGAPWSCPSTVWLHPKQPGVCASSMQTFSMRPGCSLQAHRDSASRLSPFPGKPRQARERRIVIAMAETSEENLQDQPSSNCPEDRVLSLMPGPVRQRASFSVHPPWPPLRPSTEEQAQRSGAGRGRWGQAGRAASQALWRPPFVGRNWPVGVHGHRERMVYKHLHRKGEIGSPEQGATTPGSGAVCAFRLTGLQKAARKRRGSHCE